MAFKYILSLSIIFFAFVNCIHVLFETHAAVYEATGNFWNLELFWLVLGAYIYPSIGHEIWGAYKYLNRKRLLGD